MEINKQTHVGSYEIAPKSSTELIFLLKIWHMNEKYQVL